MPAFRMPPTPPPAPVIPETPFETWLDKQVRNGHDRHWLRRNLTAMRERWEANPEMDLPPPRPPKPKPVDRYEELDR